MFSPHKHSYLQSRSDGINPRLLNRSIRLARDQEVIDCFDKNPPYLRLTSHQPNLPIGNVDVTRRFVGFGRCAMPILRRELHHTDPLIVSKAVISICELVRDPERGYEAINLRIPNRMVDLLTHQEETIRERVCMALTAIAALADGKDAIVKNYHMLVNLAHAVDDAVAAVRIKAACCLEMCSRSWMACDYLVEHGFIPVLLDSVIKDDVNIIPIHLETLSNLMYSNIGIDEALHSGGFETFAKLLNHEWPEIASRASMCIMRLTSYCPGKKVAFDADIIVDMNTLLYNECPKIYAAAAAVIMFATVKTAAKIKALEIRHLPHRLLTLANNWHYPTAQIYCLKALTNICEHPKIRAIINQECMEDLTNIVVDHDEEVKRYKEILKEVVEWTP